MLSIGQRGCPVLSPERSKFVLVDPSLTSTEGDRWQYALDFAKSAHSLQFDFVFLTHKTAPRIQPLLPFHVEERGIFELPFYRHEVVYKRHERSTVRRR